MAAKFFDYIELQYDKLTSQINNYLKGIYNKSDIQFNSASPYGQIININKELFTHSILYNKKSVSQINIDETVDKKAIRYIARISGHNPSRAISATGTLKFKLKGGVNIFNEFNSSNPSIIINNYLRLRNKTNNLEYILDLGGVDKVSYNVISNLEFNLNVIQGTYKTQFFTGTGDDEQSFIVDIPNTLEIDNFRYMVYYNGIPLVIKEHLWDMMKGEYACFTRTSFSGNLEVNLGTKNFGFVPAIGSRIEVKYLLTNGTEGELLTPVVNDWKFLDTFVDNNGNSIDGEKMFNISVENDIKFSSDGESSEYTKKVVPYVSRNFVLATPPQFVYHLSRMNMFSQIDAYNLLQDSNYSNRVNAKTVNDQLIKLKKTILNKKSYDEILMNFQNFEQLYLDYQTILNDNQIYLYLIPRYDQYFNQNINYFNVPLDVFYLDDYEKEKTLTYLRTLGIVTPATEIIIVQPKISYYVMFINARILEEYKNKEENIKQEIIQKVSDFLVNNKRTDRIIKADLISTIKSNVSGVDSVDLNFISRKNEEYHLTGKSLNKNARSTSLNQQPTYDPKLLLGIDSVVGDIVVEKDEFALIRGGWKNRDGIYFSENLKNENLSSININIIGYTKKNTKN